jgi:sarcosine oxidase subunit beta
VLTIQAMVTQPLKPLLHHVVSSGAYHCYANQTLKGEIATGAHMDPWPNYTTQNTAHYIKHQAEALSDWLPCLRGVKIHAHLGRTGRHDPGHGAHHGRQRSHRGVLHGLRLGLFRLQILQRSPASTWPQYMAKGNCPDMLKPFHLRRYEQHRLMGETAALVSYTPDN